VHGRRKLDFADVRTRGEKGVLPSRRDEKRKGGKRKKKLEVSIHVARGVLRKCTSERVRQGKREDTSASQVKRGGKGNEGGITVIATGLKGRSPGPEKKRKGSFEGRQGKKETKDEGRAARRQEPARATRGEKRKPRTITPTERKPARRGLRKSEKTRKSVLSRYGLTAQRAKARAGSWMPKKATRSREKKRKRSGASLRLRGSKRKKRRRRGKIRGEKRPLAPASGRGREKKKKGQEGILHAAPAEKRGEQARARANR